MTDPFLDELESGLPEEEKRLIHKQVDIAVQLEEYIKEKRTSNMLIGCLRGAKPLFNTIPPPLIKGGG